MKEKIDNWILKHETIIIIGTFVTILIICLIAANIYKDKYYKTQIDTLTKDNTQLELDLADRDNQIYELNLELNLTEKELAETVKELDTLINEQECLNNIGLTYVGEYKCTAYCCEKYSHICGSGNGKTASGAPLTADVSVAVTDLKTFPYGTIIYIDGVGIRIVQDTGSFPKNQIDVAVDTHKHATHWEGQGKHKVYILEVQND